MSVRRRKLERAIGYVMLAILLCLVGGIAMITWWQKTTSCYNDSPPLRSFVVTIDTSQQKKLIGQFQEFADKNRFNLGITYYTPNHEEFLIDLTRKDLEVFASNTSFNLDRYFVTFHNNDCIHPTTASDISGLVNDLKSLVSKIPAATFTEEK